VGENVPPALDEKITVPLGSVEEGPKSVTVTLHEELVSGVIRLDYRSMRQRPDWET
jgi:hypothetical protein